MESLEYIDNYFNGELHGDEAQQFEKKIDGDPVFAGEVAFYLSALQAAKDLSADDTKKRFREIYRQGNITGRTAPVRRLWPYIAAAAVIAGIIFGMFIFIKPASSPQQLADQYIQQHFTTLDVTMSSREDNRQRGLRLYNEGKFPDALQQFEKMAQSDTADFNAKKYAGIVCLKLGEYDKAINWFQQLENNSRLYSNYGKFYHALTLLKRSQNDDRILAKQLLQQVVEQGLEEKEDAAKWLRNW